MKKLLAAVTVLAVSTTQADDIIVPVYYIHEFIQFNGTNTFVDPFSDGDELRFPTNDGHTEWTG